MKNNNSFKIKFRKNPFFIELLKFGDSNSEKEGQKLSNSLKVGGFRMGNFVTSFWFGVFLFGMQSYFLRQNLKLTDVKFISD